MNPFDPGTDPVPPAPSLKFLSGGGAMGALMRSHDWSKTPFGPLETWPQSLRSALSICLESQFQIAIYWGPELAILYNDAWSDLAGNKHPWALGRPGREVWPELWDTIGPLFQHVLTTGNATLSHDELLPMHRRGFTEECYFDYTFSPIRDENGAVGGIFNIAVETTFRVLQERRQRLLRDLRDALASGRTAAEVCDLAAPALAGGAADLPFSLIYLSDHSEGSNLSLAAHTGFAANSPFIASGAPSSVWPVGDALQSQATVLVEDLPALFPDSALPAGCERALIIPIPGLGVAHSAGIFIAGVSSRLVLDMEYRSFLERLVASLAAEIAKARAFDEERRRAEALAEIDRAKTTFFSNISHEFRTPLTLMLGPIEDTLRSHRDVSPPLREVLELVLRNGLRLQRLVNALLDFSRIEAGRSRARHQPTDLSALTAELASSFRSACERAGLSLTIDCPPLPEPIYVDRDMWEKIVLNLLSNAFKFTFQGGITISLRPVAEGVQFTVADTGTGIPAHELPHLFERFHRVEGARGRSAEGSGIGLALIQELVKLHAGRISVESTPGAGSAFHVFLPRGSAHLPADLIGASAPKASTGIAPQMFVEESLRWLPDGPPGPAPAAPAANGHILLADDNADMRDYVRRLLSQHYQVTAVPDGEQALEAARAHLPDLVLTDIMMPRLDGYGLLRSLREDPLTALVPVILLSARAGEESRIEGLETGADDYVAKPFSSRDLLARVRAHLNIARLRREALETVRRSEAQLRIREQQLAQQVAEFEALFRELPVGVGVAHDPGCKVVRINPALAELLGISDREITFDPLAPDRPRTFRILKEGREVSDADLPMQVAAREGRIVRGFEFDIVRQDGTAIYEYGNAVPLFDDDGNVRGAIGVLIDLTERKRTEETLRLSDAELRRANLELEQFAYSAAHDLQEPLRAVLIYSDLLRNSYGGKLDARADQYLGFCRDGAKRMESLIRDLLAYASAASQPEQVFEPVDLNQVVDKALESLRATIDETRARVMVAPLPALTVEPVRFQQLFQNLIGNALKYGRMDTPPVIHVSAERTEGNWTFSVSDNGIGIDPKYHQRVFEMFKRVEGQNRRGSGLGLAICQKIVERYRGKIWVESAVGEGSTFRFALPADLHTS